MSAEDNYNIQIKDQNAFTGYQPGSQLNSSTIPAASMDPIEFDFVMCVWTCIFKTMQVVFYFILKLVLGIDLLTFVFVVILVSFDFWTTKNITGRKLTGLRWWTERNQHQEEEWIFESSGPDRVINSFNQNFFWLCQTLIVVFWIFLSFINLITLSFFWMLLAVFGGFLSGLNLVCFYKCRGTHQNKMQYLAQKIGVSRL